MLIGLIRRRQAELEADAFALGARFLSEQDDALLRHWRALWDIWQKETPVAQKAVAA